MMILMIVQIVEDFIQQNHIGKNRKELKIFLLFAFILEEKIKHFIGNPIINLVDLLKITILNQLNILISVENEL